MPEPDKVEEMTPEQRRMLDRIFGPVTTPRRLAVANAHRREATAIGGTDDARRSSRSDEGRSPFVGEHAPVTDGPGSHIATLAKMLEEERREIPFFGMHLSDSRREEIERRIAALAEAIAALRNGNAGGPAVTR
jgi:hypothetical protein